MKEKEKKLCKDKGSNEISRRGFLYELLMEIENPRAYRAYVRSLLHMEAEQVTAKAKAALASKSFMRKIDRVSNQLMKGALDDED